MKECPFKKNTHPNQLRKEFRALFVTAGVQFVDAERGYRLEFEPCVTIKVRKSRQPFQPWMLCIYVRVDESPIIPGCDDFRYERYTDTVDERDGIRLLTNLMRNAGFDLDAVILRRKLRALIA